MAANWQDSCDVVQDSMAHLLETGQGSDVKFFLWNGIKNLNGIKQFEVVQGHKLIIASRSSFFDELFQYRQSLGLNNEIMLKSIQAADFKIVLKFLYTNDHSGINEQNIARIYSAAKTYRLIHLQNKVMNLLITTVNEHELPSTLQPGSIIQSIWAIQGDLMDATNVFELKKAANKHTDENLVKICWLFIEGDLLELVNKDVLTKENKQDLMNHEPLKNDKFEWSNYLDLVRHSYFGYFPRDAYFLCTLLQKWSSNAGFIELADDFGVLKSDIQDSNRENEQKKNDEHEKRSNSEDSVTCLEDSVQLVDE